MQSVNIARFEVLEDSSPIGCYTVWLENSYRRNSCDHLQVQVDWHTLNIKGLRCFETPVANYQSTWYNVPEDLNLESVNCCKWAQHSYSSVWNLGWGYEDYKHGKAGNFEITSDKFQIAEFQAKGYSRSQIIKLCSC